MCPLLLVALVVFLSGRMFPGGVAAVAGVPVGACLRFTRCRVWCFFLLYEKIQAGRRLVFPGGVEAAGVRFLLKKRTKKRKHENV